MLNYAILIFVITAIGGLILAAHVLRGKFAPWAVSIIHALLGASGIVTLIVMVYQGDAPQRVAAALGLFVCTALLGFFLVSFHLRRKLPPKAVVFIHAGLAITAFLTLLSVVL